MNNADLKVTALDFAYRLNPPNAESAVENAKVIYEWLKEKDKPQPVLDRAFL